MKKLIILRGSEASGKTSVLKELIADRFLSEKQIVVKDEVAQVLGFSQEMDYTSEVREKLYAEFRKRIFDVLKNEEFLIVEAPFSDAKSIIETLEFILKNFGGEFVVALITIIADFETRRRRALSRKECVGFSRRKIDNRVAFTPHISIDDESLNVIPNTVIDSSRLTPEEVKAKILIELAIRNDIGNIFDLAA